MIRLMLIGFLAFVGALFIYAAGTLAVELYRLARGYDE